MPADRQVPVHVTLLREMPYLSLDEVPHRLPIRVQGEYRGLRQRARLQDQRPVVDRVPRVDGVLRVKDYRAEVLVEDLEAGAGLSD